LLIEFARPFCCNEHNKRTEMQEHSELTIVVYFRDVKKGFVVLALRSFEGEDE
jgi:hypothetical protein